MLRRILATVLLIAGVALLGGAPAYAGDPAPGFNPTSGGGTELDYTNTVTTPGAPGAPGSSGSSSGTSSQPTCDLAAHPDATWCSGTLPCLTKVTLPPLALPPNKPADPDTEAMSDWCYTDCCFSPIRTYWATPSTPPTPPLAAQAKVARGKLDLALPTLSTSPVNRTLVTVPTWFWVEGAAPTQTGSSAFGLVAIATIKSLNVTTGDGTTLTCPWTTSAKQAEQDCQHVYTRTSYDGTETWEGRPAYAVSASATWEIHFEMNGVRIDIPGEPGTIDGPASTAVLRVDEMQTLVTDAR